MAMMKMAKRAVTKGIEFKARKWRNLAQSLAV